MRYYDLFFAFTNLKKKLHAKTITDMHITELDNIDQDTLFLDHTYYNRTLTPVENKKIKLKAARLIGYKGTINIGAVRGLYLYKAEEWLGSTRLHMDGPNGLCIRHGGYILKPELKFPVVKYKSFFRNRSVGTNVRPFEEKDFLALLYNMCEKFFIKHIVASRWVTETCVFLYLRDKFDDYKKLAVCMNQPYVQSHKLASLYIYEVNFKSMSEYSKCPR